MNKFDAFLQSVEDMAYTLQNAMSAANAAGKLLHDISGRPIEHVSRVMLWHETGFMKGKGMKFVEYKRKLRERTW